MILMIRRVTISLVLALGLTVSLPGLAGRTALGQAPDPCAGGGCTCLGNCGSQWSGSGSRDFRSDDVRDPQYVETPRPAPTPPSVPAWRQRLEGELAREREQIQSNLHTQFAARLGDITSAAPPLARMPAQRPGRALFGVSANPDTEILAPADTLTPPATVASENLRRCIAILGAMDAVPGSGWVHAEDIRYLADEAGRAISGQELHIVVPGSRVSELSTEEERELKELYLSVDRTWLELSGITKRRLDIQTQLIAIDRQVHEAKTAHEPGLMERQTILSRRYRDAFNEEEKAMHEWANRLTEFEGRIEIVLHGKGE